MSKSAEGSVPPKRKPHDEDRSRFRQLIAQNPNYFGNLADSPLKAVNKIVANTSYEELTCVGYNPKLEMLEATVQVKLPFGYGGNLCMAGTIEYVRFFVDYGGGWQDAGVAGFKAHDIPNNSDCEKKPDKPLLYSVTRKIDPKRDFCGRPVMPNVRAILSWNWMPPPNPNWPPVWGNVLDRHIQIEPRSPLVLDIADAIAITLKQSITLPKVFEDAKHVPIPLPDPPPLNTAELAKVYRAEAAGRVEAHRFGLQDIHAAFAPGGLAQDAIVGKMNEWQAADLNWQEAAAALQNTSGNTSYEQLNCLGLDNNQEWLVATFGIKKPYGYSGGLCQKGSVEYVAFWADWDNTCQWEYLGTVPVKVHDIPTIPLPDGLHYAAILPVDLTYHRRPCKTPPIGRVRAVLSWSVPPSTSNPDAVPYWGNRVDVHVQINPGEVEDPNKPKPNIRALGGIPVEDIDTAGNGMTLPGAAFWYDNSPADPWGLNRACPFGGRIIVHGKFLYGFKYRVKVHKVGDPPGAYTALTDSFQLLRWDIGYDTQSAAGEFFTYVNPALYLDTKLAVWTTSGDAMWEVQLDVADMLNNVLASTPWLRIQLDNTPPAAQVSLDGGPCDKYTPGTTVKGKYVATDLHMGVWSLDTLPNSLGPPNPSPASGNSNTLLPDPGDAWTLNTAGMQPCGYVILLQVWDRTIVGSIPGSHNYAQDDVGFCLLDK